jgi:hypothetical protein
VKCPSRLALAPLHHQEGARESRSLYETRARTARHRVSLGTLPKVRATLPARPTSGVPERTPPERHSRRTGPSVCSDLMHGLSTAASGARMVSTCVGHPAD